jgi:uncharacterized membrane protein
MGVLIAGLVIFLGVHSLRLTGARDALRARLGRPVFMGLYSLASVIGLGLIVWGFGLARPSALLWSPPEAARWIALGAVPLALILTLAAYLPGTMRARLRHPMTIGVLIWALAHLLANGEAASVALFASFALWSGLVLIAAYRRTGGPAPGGRLWADGAAVLGGLALAGLMVHLHPLLFGAAVLP